MRYLKVFHGLEKKYFTFCILLYSYCMRTRLDKIPDDNWMCEECVLAEDKAKMAKAKLGQFATLGKYPSSNQSYNGDEISKGSGLKVLPQMNSKGSVVSKSRGRKVSSLSSADRVSSNRISALMRKRVALGTRSGPSLTCRDGKTPHPQNFTIKTSDELSMPNELSSRTRIIREKAGFPSTLGKNQICLFPSTSNWQPVVFLIHRICF